MVADDDTSQTVTDTHRMRDGTVVADERLGRLVQFDERSRSYPLTAVLEQHQIGTRDADRVRSYTWRARELHDQNGLGSCFPAGTRVLMADGSYRPIENLRVLDRVVSAEGNVRRVLAVMARPADQLVKLRLRGHRHLRATPEHPILVRRNVGSRRRPVYETMYVPVSKLRTGDFADYAAVPRWNDAEAAVIHARSLIDLSEFAGVLSGQVKRGGVITHVAPVPELLAKTPALGRLLGLYAAEGSIGVHKVIWSFGGHEKALAGETIDLIKTTFDAAPRLQSRPNGTFNVVLYGKPWRYLFTALVPGTAKHGDKRLSGHVATGPADYLRALWQGWMDGDSGVTVSHELALQFHRIANHLGLRPIIRGSVPSPNRYAASRQYRWDLRCGDGSGQNQQPMNDQATWRKVVKIDPERFSGMVFNLQVEGDESYIAEGIGVHNCVAFCYGHCAVARPRERLGELTYDRLTAIYRRAQAIDPWPETREGGTEGTSMLAGVKIMVADGFFAGYDWVFGRDDGLATALAALSWYGPLAMGTWWHRDMFRPDPSGWVRPTGGRVGGHAWLTVRLVARTAQGGPAHRIGDVDLDRSWVENRNSWGGDWGRDGNFRMTLRDWNGLRLDGGECLRPRERGGYFGG